MKSLLGLIWGGGINTDIHPVAIRPWWISGDYISALRGCLTLTVWPWPWFIPHRSGCNWATLRRHSGLFRAATSASSQVRPIGLSLTSPWYMLLQLVRGRHGPLLNPGTSQCSASWGMRCWSMRITCPSQRSLLSLSTSSMQCCLVLALTSSFVTQVFKI